MGSATVKNFILTQSTCLNCGLAALSPPDNKTSSSIHDCNSIKHNSHYERGKHLFRANDEFSTVYGVRTGSVKTYTNLNNGKEQVTGFHLPGELLGLESISTGHHTVHAIALESSTLCEISFKKLEDLSANSPSLQHALLKAMSEEIIYDHRQLTLVSKVPAEPRLASFILSISQNFKKRGMSASDFYLSMTRGDIANLLGLAVETVSRLFSKFQDLGFIAVDKKHILILDETNFQKLADQLNYHTRQNISYHKKVV